MRQTCLGSKRLLTSEKDKEDFFMIHPPSQEKRIHFLYLCFTTDNRQLTSHSVLVALWRKCVVVPHLVFPTFAQTFNFASSSSDLGHTSYEGPIAKQFMTIPL